MASLPFKQVADINLAFERLGFQLTEFPQIVQSQVTIPNCTGLTGEALKQCQCEASNACADVTYYFHPDHLGASTFLSDAAGQPYQIVKKNNDILHVNYFTFLYRYFLDSLRPKIETHEIIFIIFAFRSD